MAMRSPSSSRGAPSVRVRIAVPPPRHSVAVLLEAPRRALLSDAMHWPRSKPWRAIDAPASPFMCRALGGIRCAPGRTRTRLDIDQVRASGAHRFTPSCAAPVRLVSIYEAMPSQFPGGTGDQLGAGRVMPDAPAVPIRAALWAIRSDRPSGGDADGMLRADSVCVPRGTASADLLPINDRRDLVPAEECGSRGGPRYRRSDGRCAGWKDCGSVQTEWTFSLGTNRPAALPIITCSGEGAPRNHRAQFLRGRGLDGRSSVGRGKRPRSIGTVPTDKAQSIRRCRNSSGVLSSSHAKRSVNSPASGSVRAVAGPPSGRTREHASTCRRCWPSLEQWSRCDRSVIGRWSDR
jgi:hypothetical protein